MSTSQNAIDRSSPNQTVTLRLCGLAVGTSVVLFLISLTQDGFYIDRVDDPRAWAPCYALLLLGWLALFDGVFAWLANPAIIAAWLSIWFRLSRIAAIGFAVLALSLSLSFMLHDDILTNEAGGRSRITSYGTGYWLWIASIGTMVLGTTAVWLFTVFAHSPETPVDKRSPVRMAAKQTDLPQSD